MDEEERLRLQNQIQALQMAFAMMIAQLGRLGFDGRAFTDSMLELERGMKGGSDTHTNMRSALHDLREIIELGTRRS